MYSQKLLRRTLLQTALGGGAFFLLPGIARAAGGAAGDAEQAAFSFELLTERARELAQQAYQPPEIEEASILEEVDYDRHNEIRFRKDRALWGDGTASSQARFFFPGRYFKQPVHLYALDGGMATEIPFSLDLFDIPSDNPARRLSKTEGFAGFSVMDAETERDWMAFLGASYWRTSGYSGQFGLSARGLAIDTAIPDGPEEFPLFTHFWLEPETESGMTTYALLDSPRATGAYRIVSRRGEGVVQEITARIFMRDPVERLGIAPLTSMYWFGKNTPHVAPDWRPEVHDSDGLEILTHTGERIWRPLNNPPHTMANTFTAPSVKGFGLMQRERNFEQYQDDGVFYEKRASAWIAPSEDWGDGAVTLVELSTDDEIHDNIVAFWQPAAPARRGDEYELSYTLSWLKDGPLTGTTGQFAAVRIGAGGVPGQPRPQETVKIVCDFTPWSLGSDDKPHLNITASRGVISNDAVYPIVGSQSWRAMFDLGFGGPEELVARDDSPIDLRVFVAKAEDAVTETLLLQLFPAQLRALLSRRP
ncbi:OpgD/OpgG family glucan biosynthesis protein [Paracoccus denitrificans]|uniref:glucan biosynthesis protein n=1 Tax=Paracoccus denitrificans TaxID=266 RepID=UPI000CECB263|nr:glucan biosynthesis protein D [Paracoccus denitrificans]UFS66812.1 glucan biosynthesis protein D [Paracoccus denitrificans]